jgi:hypothetical protein
VVLEEMEGHLLKLDRLWYSEIERTTDPEDATKLRNRLRKRIENRRRARHCMTSPDEESTEIHYWIVTRFLGPRAVIVSTVDLSIGARGAPLRGVWLPSIVALYRLARFGLALPGVQRVSGDKGGWNVSGREDRKVREDPTEMDVVDECVGSATQEQADRAYEMMADESQRIYDIRPLMYGDWPSEIPTEWARSALKRAFRTVTSVDPWAACGDLHDHG